MIFQSWNFKYMKILLLFIILFSFNVYSQEKPLIEKKFSIFPDEYSELDDISTPIYTTDEYVLDVLQSARKSYIKAIVLANKKDTIQAERYFQISIELINSLASYPDIISNTDFTDLAVQIMEDYESFANKTDLIDENSPLFMIRDKLFSEIDKELSFNDLRTIKDQKVASTGVVEQKLPVALTIPMPENEVVKKSIKWFTETPFGRKVFQVWYSKHTKWFPMMKRIATEEGVPEEIVYLSMIESGLEPNAVSKASAVGLWQFMYATGKDFGLNSESSIWLDERRDPEKSTRAAMQYLKFLYNEFGDWHLALAAYNCGQGRVRRAIRKSGKPNPTFWEIDHLLPKESRYYVPRYISTALVAMEPSLYNFQIDTFAYHQEYQYDVYELNEPVNISALSKCLGVSDSVILALNPELIRTTTPPNVSNYKLKIPLGSKNSFALAFAKLTPEEKQPFVEHNVLSGETITKLSRKYGIDAKEIADLNGFSNPKSRLRRGARIKLPLTVAEYEEINEAAKQSGSYYPLDGSVDIVHYVKRGESLYRIARKYGVSIDYLVELNNLRSKNSTLSVGQKLVVSLKEEAEEEDIVEEKSSELPKLDKAIIVSHKVRYGESLSDIADLYDTDINKIKLDNRLRSNYVRSGRNLKITTFENPENFKNKQEKVSNSNQFAFHYVKRGETLGRIASKYGMSVSELQRENSLRGSRIIPGQKLKVQKSSSNVNTDLAEAKTISNAVHKVRKGESLFQIAKKYDLSVDQIKSLNNLTSDYLYVGQNLKVVSNGTLPSAREDFTKHTVRKGETLGHIAENYGVRASDLRKWNNIRGSRIYPGQKLLLQSNSDYTHSSTPKNVDYHTIRKGETLNSIANKYDVSVDQLKSWNNISSNNIKAGDKLMLNSDLASKGSNSNSNSGSPVYYNLKKGETLAFVGRKFGIALNEIKRLNPNVNERRLQIGQKIRVK